MAVLPEQEFTLTALGSESLPTQTWYADATAGRLAGRCDGLDAMRQAVEIALQVERYRWQIYTPNFGALFADLSGMDTNFIECEIERRVRDALSADDRITNVADFIFTQSADMLCAAFTVYTVFGTISGHMEI